MFVKLKLSSFEEQAQQSHGEEHGPQDLWTVGWGGNRWKREEVERSFS